MQTKQIRCRAQTIQATPGPMPLTEDQKDEIRRLLEKEVAKLERSIQISGKSAKPVRLDQQSVGRLSRMDALQNQGMAQRLQARDGERLTRLLEALDRLDAGELGVCANCGEEIAYGRLEVFPETEVCGGCG